MNPLKHDREPRITIIDQERGNINYCWDACVTNSWAAIMGLLRGSSTTTGVKLHNRSKPKKVYIIDLQKAVNSSKSKQKILWASIELQTDFEITEVTKEKQDIFLQQHKPNNPPASVFAVCDRNKFTIIGNHLFMVVNFTPYGQPQDDRSWLMWFSLESSSVNPIDFIDITDLFNQRMNPKEFKLKDSINEKRKQRYSSYYPSMVWLSRPIHPGMLVISSTLEYSLLLMHQGKITRCNERLVAGLQDLILVQWRSTSAYGHLLMVGSDLKDRKVAVKMSLRL